MQIPITDLPAFVTQTLLKVRTGIQAAREEGLIAELPETVEFSVDVIYAEGALVTTNTTDTTETITGGGSTTAETGTTASGGTQADTGTTTDVVAATGTNNSTQGVDSTSSETQDTAKLYGLPLGP